MSDDTTTTQDAPKPTPPAEPAQAQPEAKAETDWKAEARKWEQRARENKGAADKLAEIEESSKSEAQKLAERAEAAEKALAETTATALRNEIALTKGLTPSQAKRLVGSTREELEADADDLLRDLSAAAGPRAPKPDANQGRSGAGGPKSTADSFAEYFNTHLPGR